MGYSLLMLLLFTSIASAAYPSFKDCAPFTCGNSTIQYPIGPCGLLDAFCFDNQPTLIAYVSNIYWEGGVVGEIAKSSYSTGTLQITPSHINPFDLYFHEIPLLSYASSYDWLSGDNFFNLSDADMLGTIVNCTQQPADILFNGSVIKRVDCTESNGYCFFYPGADIQIPSCYKYNIVVPTNKSYNISADKDFEQLHQRGFQIKWSIHDILCDPCKASGGRCFSSMRYCICPDDDVHYRDCNDCENLDM